MPLNLHPCNERPLSVRRRRSYLTARVNGNLRLEFGDVTLTSYAGLELFGRYLRQSHFDQLIRQACADTPLGGDFGVVAMIRLLPSWCWEADACGIWRTWRMMWPCSGSRGCA
jgi:hypothetical protein